MAQIFSFLQVAVRPQNTVLLQARQPIAVLGLKNLSVRRLVGAAVKALLDSMVGEACAYVQGESPKAHAALLTEAS